MAEKSRGLLFRKRNVLGAALVAGIGLGVYLGKFGLEFGFGLKGDGGGKDGGSLTSTDSPVGSKRVTDLNDGTETSNDKAPLVVPNVVKVLIDDRKFFLREKSKDTPIELTDLVDLMKQAPGDEHGIRVRIYQKMSARASAEEELKQALVSAAIPDDAVIWVPPAQTK